MEENIAIIYKNNVEMVHVDLTEYAGHDLVDIRIYANYASASKPKKPTKKGVSLRIGQLPELIYALEKAQRRAREAGLIKDEEQAA